jgi:pSer/pThr/pTyr-binding forkhead associated (FHA) protein
VFAILQNIDDGTSHSISSDRVNLGRASTNDIVVDDKAVSREHAVIFRDESGQFVIESSGANGTFVNHLQIERAPLSSGDLITIGDSTLRFVQAKA